MAGVEAAAISVVVSGTLKIVANKLAPLLIKEYNSIVGVKEELQELRDLVEEINIWLETTADNSIGNRQSFTWLKKLKDISDDVDDVVDEFQLRSEKHDSDGDGGIMSRYMCTIPKSFVFQCKAVNKIKAIKKRFAAIVKQRTDYVAVTNSLLVDHPIRCTNMRTKEVSSLSNVDETSVVGRDKDKHKIVSMLEANDDQLKIKIVSIIGLGGSGKTTLAKLVFNDANIIEKNFEVRLWVHVSQEFDVKDLIKKMFEAFSDNNPGPHALPYMTKTISDKLAGKRFLLVLDDVWTDSQDEWKEFMVYIKGGAPKSRILLTTRNREVAVIVGSTDQFHLPFLSPDDSWQLFQQSLITPGTSWNFEFEEVGKAIVDKCCGMPLAIKVLAGALHGKDRIEEWQAMTTNVNVQEDRVTACLRLSYSHLPSNLKQCFTICSVFPKGHKIDKEQLIDLWIAHEMISLEDGVDCLDLEYVGQKLFNSLVQVSFLQNVEEKYGRVTCGMHDLVHDLALSILGDEISLKMTNEATGTTKGYRYFSLIKWTENLVPKNIFRKTRAIYMATSNEDYINGMAFKHAKHLRSGMVGYLNAEIAKTISQIKYLKYLEVSLISGETLPEAISNVWSLQALHVTCSYSLEELPQSIGKLKRLRTLRLSNCFKLKSLPESIGDCQIISSIDLRNCREFTVLPDSIGRNEKLRVLRLSFTNIERLPSSITKLRNLECLDFQGCDELVELPEGICNLEKLKVLNLNDCNKLGGMPIGIGQHRLLPKLDLFVVGKGEKFAGISELANGYRISEKLRIRGISHVMDPNDARMTCLKQKTHLQRLDLEWMLMPDDIEEVNTDLQQDVLDGLEAPRGIKELEIHWYSGRQFARWMQSQVGGGVQGLAPFPFLRVMKLYFFAYLKHLHGLVELPCLEELELKWMPSLESISGGPFPSLVKMEMDGLPCLGEVWIVAERTISDGEEGGGCCNFTTQLGQFRVGNCITELDVSGCPKLEVKPHLPLSLQHLRLNGSEKLLQSPDQCQGSSLSPSFSHLKELKLRYMTGLGSGHGWELLQHLTALESLGIDRFSGEETELPESLWSLTSLRSLKVDRWSNIRLLPKSIGKLWSLQKLTIQRCDSLTSLPESMGQLTSLKLFKIAGCHALHQLPDCLGELCSLRKLWIRDLRELTCLPQSICCLTTSLQELSISSCPGITSLPQGMEGLVSLEELSISSCPGITSLPQGMEGLVSLEKLSISSCPGITSLPQGMEGLVSLEKLSIFSCPGLTSLPQGIKGLVSLEELYVDSCPKIKSLPEGIKSLTALKKLQIYNCPDLQRRCKRGNGEDWHLISHIPHVYGLY